MESPSDQIDWRDEVPGMLPPVTRLAIRLCGSEALAEDAVQNSMLKLMRGIDNFAGQAQLSTYFTRIVIHECRDLISRNRRELATEGLNEVLADHTIEHDPAGLMEQNEAIERIRQAVMALPDRQREVMVLSVWEQRSNAEISELLDMNIQNVYATLSMARKQLKQRLGILNQNQ